MKTVKDILVDWAVIEKRRTEERAAHLGSLIRALSGHEGNENGDIVILPGGVVTHTTPVGPVGPSSVVPGLQSNDPKFTRPTTPEEKQWLAPSPQPPKPPSAGVHCFCDDGKGGKLPATFWKRKSLWICGKPYGEEDRCQFRLG